jgi:hypothetical protein
MREEAVPDQHGSPEIQPSLHTVNQHLRKLLKFAAAKVRAKSIHRPDSPFTLEGSQIERSQGAEGREQITVQDAGLRAAERVMAHRRRCETLADFASRIGTTDKTLRKFCQTGKPTVFDTIAENLNTTVEALLAP